MLWALVAVHVVGAAFWFRRLVPRESVWLAFIVPEILVVLVCNFIEYQFALTHLALLLPVTTAASVAGIFWPKCPWRVMRLPTLVFLGSFGFTFFLRLLRPNIEDVRDGMPDLSMIANYLYGQTLPAESTWLPPVKMEVYYCFEHYAASVLIRLFGVDIGTGFNISTALLSGYVCFLAGAIAWHLSRKRWIVMLMVALTACAGPGDAGYLQMTCRWLDPQNLIDPYSMIGNGSVPGNWFLRHLTPIDTYAQHLLMPPSYGVWVGCFHSAQAGQLLVCFAILALIELVRRKRTNWPWVSLALAPILILVTCTWGLPIILFLAAGGLIFCRRARIAPANLTVVLAMAAGLAVLLERMLVYFLEVVPINSLTWSTGLHTQVLEFMVQWWPVYLPWLALFLVWRRIHPATRIVLIMSPLAFAGLEIWNFGQRFDSTSKYWGLVYVAAWVTFLPEVVRQKAWPFRLILAFVVVNAVLSLAFWKTYYFYTIKLEEMGHLDGLGQLRSDAAKARILEIVSGEKNQIIIPGRSAWANTESGLLPLFSHNRAYVAWSNFVDTIYYTNGMNEAVHRENDVNKIYDGENLHPLYFLRQRNIAALVIYPDDEISPSVVEQLKQNLAPYYSYEDAQHGTGCRNCAGVFLYRPEITSFLGPAKDDTKVK